jgi:hypothetical protein
LFRRLSLRDPAGILCGLGSELVRLTVEHPQRVYVGERGQITNDADFPDAVLAASAILAATSLASRSANTTTRPVTDVPWVTVSWAIVGAWPEAEPEPPDC